jgi:DNA processing protein
LNQADERLRAWLTLIRVPGVGPRTLSRLYAHLGDPVRILTAPVAELRAAGAREEAAASIAAATEDLAVEADLSWAGSDDAHILTRDDPRYPPRLAEVADAPAVLYLRGDPAVLADPQLAVVGSRNPTPAGRETTRELARHLAGCGITITSGLAAGVDGAAHEGALEAGRTVAVLGTGPDRVYPAAHRDLARRIAESGALVSEFPPGSDVRAENFPRRNRVISALSLGTLVTEAALKSGSLITARYAMEQGREVFAIPGSIHNPMARGCHALIRQGAKLVETAADVLEELAPQLRAFLTPAPAGLAPSGAPRADAALDGDYRRLLEAMGYDPVAPDELIRRTGLPAQAVSSMLLLLELQGYVSSHPGGRFCRSAAASGVRG